jgi:hypothetical protein
VHALQCRIPRQRIDGAVENDRLDAGDGTAHCTSAAIDDNLIGIFAGCQYIASNGSVVFSPIWAATTTTQCSADVDALVYTDPNTVFEVQCLTGTSFAQTHVGKNSNFNYSAAPGVSACGVSVAESVTQQRTRAFGVLSDQDEAREPGL